VISSLSGPSVDTLNSRHAQGDRVAHSACWQGAILDQTPRPINGQPQLAYVPWPMVSLQHARRFGLQHLPTQPSEILGQWDDVFGTIREKR